MKQDAHPETHTCTNTQAESPAQPGSTPIQPGFSFPFASSELPTAWLEVPTPPFCCAAPGSCDLPEEGSEACACQRLCVKSQIMSTHLKQVKASPGCTISYIMYHSPWYTRGTGLVSFHAFRSHICHRASATGAPKEGTWSFHSSSLSPYKRKVHSPEGHSHRCWNCPPPCRAAPLLPPPCCQCEQHSSNDPRGRGEMRL